MFKAKRPSDVIQAAAIQAAAQIVLFAASRQDEGETSPDELARRAAVGAQALLQEFEKRQARRA